MARMRAMFRCCHGALVSPYQPSSLMLTSTSAPISGKVADLVGKDGFVADEDAVAMTRPVLCGKEKDAAVGSAREVADPAGELVGKDEQIFEGNVFAERNEVDLVVAADAASVGSDDHGGVVIVPGLKVGRVFVADAADNHWRLHRSSQSGDRMLEARIGLEERRRRLGPDNEIRMGGIRRADDFAGGRAGLGDSGDVRLALLAGEVGEVGEVTVPLPRAGPAIFGGYIEIGLDQDCSGRSRRFGRLPHEPGRTRRQQNGSGQARPEPFDIHALFSIFRPMAEHQHACKQCIHGDQEKSDSIDAGPGSELIDQGVVDLRVAELIPRNAGECGPRRDRAQPTEMERAASASLTLPLARRTSITPRPNKPK